MQLEGLVICPTCSSDICHVQDACCLRHLFWIKDKEFVVQKHDVCTCGVRESENDPSFTPLHQHFTCKQHLPTASLPEILDFQLDENGRKVTTRMPIPAKALFGPLEAPLVAHASFPLRQCGSFCLGQNDGSWLEFSVVSDDECNWMKFVRFTANSSEANMVAFRFKGKFYFVAVRTLALGEELVVTYAKNYSKAISSSRSEALRTGPELVLSYSPESIDSLLANSSCVTLTGKCASIENATSSVSRFALLITSVKGPGRGGKFSVPKAAKEVAESRFGSVTSANVEIAVTKVTVAKRRRGQTPRKPSIKRAKSTVSAIEEPTFSHLEPLPGLPTETDESPEGRGMLKRKKSGLKNFLSVDAQYDEDMLPPPDVDLSLYSDQCDGGEHETMSELADNGSVDGNETDGVQLQTTECDSPVQLHSEEHEEDEQASKKITFPCKYCHKECKTKRSRNLHYHNCIENPERDTNLHECEYCGVSRQGLQNFRDHQRRCSKNPRDEEQRKYVYPCMYCRQEMAACRLPAHYPQHMTDGKYNCPVEGCTFSGKTVEELKIHHTSKHKDRRKSRGVYKKSLVRSTPSTHNVEKVRPVPGAIIKPDGFYCGTCGVRVAGGRPHVKIHLQSHQMPESICPHCGEVFTSEKGMKYHVKRYHSEGAILPRMRVGRAHRNVRQDDYRTFFWKCEDCKLGFRMRETLVSHLDAIHPDKAKSTIPELNLPRKKMIAYGCVICLKPYLDLDRAENHLRNASGHDEETLKKATTDLGKPKGPELGGFFRPMEIHVYSCEVCKSDFKGTREFHHHARKEHPAYHEVLMPHVPPDHVYLIPGVRVNPRSKHEASKN